VAPNSKRKKPARKESTAVKIPLDFETAMNALLRVPRADIDKERRKQRQSKMSDGNSKRRMISRK